MGRWDKLLADNKINEGDEESYPPNEPRNWIADRLNGKTIPFAAKLGLNESIDIPKVNAAQMKRDNIERGQVLTGTVPFPDASPLMGVKQVGSLAAKLLKMATETSAATTGAKLVKGAEELASEVPAASTLASKLLTPVNKLDDIHEEHIQNFRGLREFLKHRNEAGYVGHGTAQTAFEIPELPGKVIKTANSGVLQKVLDNRELPDAIRDQLIYNKIPELTADTKTYLTSGGKYQVQNKVLPLLTRENPSDARLLEQTYGDDLKSLANTIKSKGNGVHPIDVGTHNAYLDSVTKSPKIFDVDQFVLRDGHTKLDDILKLRDTLKKPSGMDISEPLQKFLGNPEFDNALSDESTNYLNEILKLKGKK